MNWNITGGRNPLLGAAMKKIYRCFGGENSAVSAGSTTTHAVYGLPAPDRQTALISESKHVEHDLQRGLDRITCAGCPMSVLMPTGYNRDVGRAYDAWKGSCHG